MGKQVNKSLQVNSKDGKLQAKRAMGLITINTVEIHMLGINILLRTKHQYSIEKPQEKYSMP
jgi:hypothetical protein